MSQVALDIELLTVEQRLDLIDQLWRSVAAENPPLSAEQRAVLDQRIDRLERDGPSGLSLDDMWTRIDSTV